MKRKNYITLFSVSLLSLLVPESANNHVFRMFAGNAPAGRAYYVRNGGNDKNSGLSDAQAWASVNRVNRTGFSAGDRILFKRGSTWTEPLAISSSGSSASPITYGAYGEGEKPVFDGMTSVPGWKIPGKWTNVRDNIWKLYWAPGSRRFRLWIDSTEVMRCETSSVTSEERWAWLSDYLYVYSTSNPSTAFSDIRSNNFGSFMTPSSKQYITLQNLDVRGWYDSRFYGCSNFIIEYCDWGRNFSLYGIAIRKNNASESSGGIIRFCTFDTYDRFNDKWQVENSEDAINIGTGVNGWDIHHNNFRAWGHSTFYIYAEPGSNAPIKNIKFHHNHITNADNDYGRGINTDVPGAGQSSGIEIFDNLIEDQAVNSQLQSPGTRLYNNIFNRCRGTRSHGDAVAVSGHALCITGYYGRPQGMEIFNNVFANCNGYGLLLRNDELSYPALSDNKIVNNIFYNNGGVDKWFDKFGISHIQLCVDVNPNSLRNTFRNNLFYTPKTSNPVRYKNTALSVAAFNALTGNNQDLISGNITGNPLFADGINDFHIVANSPAKYAGTAVGLESDYDGVKWHDPPSIGAFEYRESK
jgi:hypothetical protein